MSKVVEQSPVVTLSPMVTFPGPGGNTTVILRRDRISEPEEVVQCWGWVLRLVRPGAKGTSESKGMDKGAGARRFLAVVIRELGASGLTPAQCWDKVQAVHTDLVAGGWLPG